MSSPTAAQLQAALDNFVDNLDNKLDIIINGNSSTDVTIDSGTVPTIAKLFNQMTSSLTAASYEFTASASQTDFVCTGADIPGVNSVVVTVDGDTQRPSSYTIQTTTTSNDTVRLGSGLSGGELVEVRLLAAPQSIGTGDATNINFNQGSTGYSARSVEDKFRDEALSLLDFGADPTGAASSAGALSSAMDAAMALGLPLHIPAGTYTLSSWTTKTTTADLHIIGDPGALLDYTGGVSTAYFVTPAHSLTLDTLEFDGFPRVVSQGTHGGTRADRFVFRNNKVTGCNARCIYMLQPFETADFSNNIFDGTGTAVAVTSYIQIGIGGSGTEGDYRNLNFRNNVLENFDLDHAGTQRLIDLMVEKSHIEENLIRNTERTTNANQVELMRIVGNQNQIRQNTIDTFTNTSAASVVKGILIQGQDRVGSLPAAPSSGSTGLFGYANTVEGNRVKGLVGVTTCYGIQVSAEDSIVKGNIVEDITTTGGGSTSYGILYSTSTTTDNAVITNNIITGSPRDGIYVDTDGSAVIAQNSILGFLRYGIYANCDAGGVYVGTINGNTIMDNAATTESPSAGIRLQRGNWSCTGNSVTGSGTIVYGIYVAQVTADCVIASNHIDAGVTAPIQTTTGADPHLIHGNSIVSGSIVNNNSSLVYNNMIGGSIDSAPGVFAACRVTLTGLGGTLEAGSTNVTSINHDYNNDELEINFTSAAADADYLVFVTSDLGATPDIDRHLRVKSRGTSQLVLGYDNDTYPANVYVIVHKF